MQIGPYTLDNNLVLAPMAGVTDKPFRQLCRQMGAGLVVSEMLTADKRLWNSKKSVLRREHSGEPGPISVQIAGSIPDMMAEAAQLNVEHGAQMIDINMGCPAKKVCKRAAGSALLREPDLVREIVKKVVASVSVPVTLKIRTGWSPEQRNGVEIARIAESEGIQALAVHGRTRACRFNGLAEYDTIAEIKQAVSIPIIANGDINNAKKAKEILEYTQADGLMIGRAAQGNPWLFQQIGHFLATGEQLAPPSINEVRHTLLEHVAELHSFYGEFMGLRISRKHMSWYLAAHRNHQHLRQQFNKIEIAEEQLQFIEQHFSDSNIAA